MQLDPLYIQVLPRLTNTGSNEHAEGALPLTSIEIGFRHFQVAEGIGYDINLTNTSEAILLSGTATANLSASCDRCLESTEISLTGEIQGYYLFEPLEEPGDDKLETYEMVDSSGRIDIAPPLLAAIVYELPPVTLCRADCEGLISEAPLGAPVAESAKVDPATDGINPESPFAALKDYPFDE
ncbi:MAG: DUF177 domain-containing protein [Coriobacteriia bacterium]|nr:DUF177 domain-containing protein [Coriobacteriia bacterium]MCL2750790.1 DUF177 domain-containing protein [Coriobacteriia bacterium]